MSSVAPALLCSRTCDVMTGSVYRFSELRNNTGAGTPPCLLISQDRSGVCGFGGLRSLSWLGSKWAGNKWAGMVCVLLGCGM